jgi:hypothetical protein
MRFGQKKYDQGLSEALTLMANTLAAAGDGREKSPNRPSDDLEKRTSAAGAYAVPHSNAPTFFRGSREIFFP